ncbi:SpoIIE family protein phosphatase [Microbispora tritici]|uniref:SpoIIE family protein phosphatase n=2 Tax=Microbispora TaxID=2005 RepID=A0ABY3LTY5_9ACTN|nr:HAMP domain-containing protein [Microbispora fusca]TYB54449.1 SpoIIE family protein phosphatase [Microbispora tritici]
MGVSGSRRTRRAEGKGGLTRRTIVVSVLLLGLISGAFAFLLPAIVGLREAVDLTNHSRHVLTSANHLQRLVIDLETGQRGFVIAGEESFLQPWRQARAAIPEQAATLERLATAGAPAQGERARRIRQSIEAYIRDYSVPTVEAARRDPASVHTVAVTQDGKRRVDAIRGQFQQFVTFEDQLLASRQAHAAEAAVRATAVASIGVVGSILLILAFDTYLIRSIVRPVRKAAAVASRLADGDLTARMPETGAGEIGELEVAFNSMGHSLEESRKLTEKAHRRLQLLYDASTAVGTTLDVRRTAEELVEVVVPEFADFVTVDLEVAVVQGDDHHPDEGETLCRVAIGGIGNTASFHPPGGPITWAPPTPQARSLDRGLPVIEPDLRTSTAWRSRDPEEAARILDHGIHSLITTPLRARGMRMGVVSFWRSRLPGRFDEEDLSYAAELAAKAGVVIDNARRYTHERKTALTLQRSLLPQRLPVQPAVEIASRYLPAGAQTGVGGDWFDVIPLSGCRVALVVGDVVGHGIHAAATMGRLRTAVRTLADVDLPPDELLTHLDDLVIHLTGDEQPGTAEGDTAAFAELGATCLYAVYDPVSRCCTMATAGHPLPVLVALDGATELVSGPVGPPLGVGGLPFETTELRLTAGTVVALFTDGLIESRDRDIDQGLAELRRALALPTASLEDTCDTVTGALLGGRAADDAALLLARTAALSPDQIVTWDVPADPAVVTYTRKLAIDQLLVWGLAEMEFVTGLVVSELVTNAMRHGTGPIQLRLIRDRTLICEVSDGSNTAPHLRRARVFDEGGRGLLLVAQLTQSWGTRQSTCGKTIWCEQALPPPVPSSDGTHGDQVSRAA